MSKPVRAIASLIAFAIVAAAPSAGQAGDFPTRPIKVVVAFPPGGGADLTARTVAQKLGESMHQPVVVENRAGANGAVGAASVAKATPDGYTLLFIDRGALGINPSLYAKLAYDPVKDFAHVCIATEAPYVLVVNPALGVGTVAELATLARRRPGELLYGSFGIGSMAQLNLESLNRRLGIELRHVPYKGAGPAVQAVVAGEVGVALASAPSVLGFLREGRLRAIAVGSARRLSLLPDVPTMAEAGLGADVLLPTWFAFSAPAGTPDEIVARLNAEMRRALAAPEVVEQLSRNGLVPYGSTPQAMASTVREDVARFAAITKAIGLKPE
ncbi:MAG: Bug family tripartite tricarboxylate transporter substrate binding protein [Lautropia sp.]